MIRFMLNNAKIKIYSKRISGYRTLLLCGATQLTYYFIPYYASSLVLAYQNPDFCRTIRNSCDILRPREPTPSKTNAILSERWLPNLCGAKLCLQIIHQYVKEEQMMFNLSLPCIF